MSRPGGKHSRGKNAIREMHSPTVHIGDDLFDVRLPQGASVYRAAVVEDIILNPETLSRDYLKDLRERVKNPEIVDHIPRNTILGRILDQNADKRDSKPTLLLPFFPPHVQMPISPGETALVTSISADDYNDISYWMWRLPTLREVDDVNFTHHDRTYFVGRKRTSTSERALGSQEDADLPSGKTVTKNGKPGFPNCGS